MKLIDYFKKAQKEKWAVGQFNISNLEALKAVFQAAKELKSPVIIGTSEGESGFFGMKEAVLLLRMLRKDYGFPVFLNLDHGKTFDYIKEAVDAGYDSVHFDGSKLSLEENIGQTKKIRDYAKKKKVLVEGEVGIIQGSSVLRDKSLELKLEDMTDPENAFLYLKETKTDSLALSIGNSHGMEKTGINSSLDFARLKEIREKTKDLPLVLHGGSGISESDIKSAIKGGIVKININTELRVAFTGALKNFFQNNPEEMVPYKYLPCAIKAVKEVVEKKIRILGSLNKI